MTKFKGKAIYQPAGKAAEYAEWACNFYIGCSNGCTYCYLKKGRGAKILGGDKPTLKKCFKDEDHAIEVFKREIKANLPELQEKGIFFSFSTDPMLFSNFGLTVSAIHICINNNVPVKTLSKYTFLWVKDVCNGAYKFISEYKHLIAFGFTLTGHDELEPGASTNAERIEAMKKLHDAGFKTFASIEPVIEVEDSEEMIINSLTFCDLYKIGLQSGKTYKHHDLNVFIQSVTYLTQNCAKIYFKDSLLKAAGIERSQLPSNCVTKDYNLFK